MAAEGIQGISKAMTREIHRFCDRQHLNPIRLRRAMHRSCCIGQDTHLWPLRPLALKPSCAETSKEKEKSQ